MAAFCHDHGVVAGFGVHHTAHIAVSGAVESDVLGVCDRDDTAIAAGADKFFNLYKAGMIAQNVADAHYAVGFDRFMIYVKTLFVSLCDRLLEQDVIALTKGFHTGFVVLALGRTDENCVGLDRVAEKVGVAREAVFGGNVKLVGHGVSPNCVGFDDRDKPGALRMLLHIVHVCSHTIADSDCNNRSRLS